MDNGPHNIDFAWKKNQAWRTCKPDTIWFNKKKWDVFLTRCSSKTIIVFTISIFVFANGYDNYVMLKIHYSDMFTKPPIGKYINSIISCIYDVDTNLFLVHELDEIVRELGYQNGQTLYYNFLYPRLLLRLWLISFRNDQDVPKMVTYVPKHRIIRLDIENGQTKVPTYFKSPFKVVIKEWNLTLCHRN